MILCPVDEENQDNHFTPTPSWVQTPNWLRKKKRQKRPWVVLLHTYGQLVLLSAPWTAQCDQRHGCQRLISTTDSSKTPFTRLLNQKLATSNQRDQKISFETWWSLTSDVSPTSFSTAEPQTDLVLLRSNFRPQTWAWVSELSTVQRPHSSKWLITASRLLTAATLAFTPVVTPLLPPPSPPPHWPLHSYHTNSSVYLLRNSSSGRAPVLKHLEQTGAFTKMFFSSKPQFSIPKEICKFKQCRRICPILTCWMLKQRIFWMWASRLLNTQLIPRLKHSHKHSSATSLLLRRGPMNHCTVVYDHMASFLNFLLWSMLCWLILFCVWWFCCFLHTLIMHSIMQWNRWKKKNHKIITPPFKVNQCRRRLWVVHKIDIKMSSTNGKVVWIDRDTCLSHRVHK